MATPTLSGRFLATVTQDRSTCAAATLVTVVATPVWSRRHTVPAARHNKLAFEPVDVVTPPPQ